MSVALDYRKIILNITKELPEKKLKELIDFAQFLKTQKQGSTYVTVKDSAEYVRSLRTKEAKKVKSGKKFIKELVEWQDSNS